MLSVDRDILDGESEAYKRMIEYSNLVEELHIIVFSRDSDDISARNTDNLFLYPTEAKRKYQHLLRAISIGRKKVHDAELITVQDPYDTGLVGYILKLLLRKPLQVQEHGDVFSTHYWRTEKSANNIKYKIGVFVLKRADCIRVVSERIKRTLVRKFKIDEKKIQMLHVRTDFAKFANTKPRIDVHKDYLEFDTIVLTMARLVKQKNLPLLINAFANIVEDNPKALLLIVGEGPEEAHLKNQVMRRHIEDNVKFLPWTEDVVSYMKTADIYALSSNYEGWARTLIEAMASKIPIVTTNVGCVGQVLIHNQDGLVVPVNDEALFTKALRILMDDKTLRNRLTAHAFQKVHTLQNQFMHYRELKAQWDNCVENK